MTFNYFLQSWYSNLCSMDTNMTQNGSARLFSCHSKGMPEDDFIQGTFTLVNSTKLTGSSINERVCCPIKRRDGCWWGNGTC